ncbi:hypothetical protein B0O40_2134 [Ruminococcaceae bacterium R-25]|nr:hypothetical protein B0O40_2134 [Ruminococcaceae bacterium R-25]SUQ21993.1 hypothetical protein SAMN06297423_2134 [Oscillospiraceae bacterium]
MELNKCPNCSGKLALAKNRKRLVCSYCGSEFPLDEITKSEISGQPVNMDWFIYDWDFESLMANDACKTVVQSFIRTLNEFETSSKIESYIREYLMGFDDVSANGIREENMRDVVRRLMPNFLPGERVILFYDDGVFVHGKTGILITNKRTFFVERKTFRDVKHVTIPYIDISCSMGYPIVRLGDKYKNDVGGGSGFISHFDLEGAVTALICAFAFEERPDRPKIKLCDSL